MRAVLLALLTLVPVPALACSPVLFTPSETPVYGERCAIVTHVDPIRAVGLSSLTDLGQGLAYQDIFDGNACYWEANLLVHDCSAGEILVIGEDNRALMTEPRETGIDRIVEAMQSAGTPMTLDALSAMAEAEGYATRLRLTAGTRLSVNGHGVPTNCACDTLRREGRVTR